MARGARAESKCAAARCGTPKMLSGPHPQGAGGGAWGGWEIYIGESTNLIHPLTFPEGGTGGEGRNICIYPESETAGIRRAEYSTLIRHLTVLEGK